MKAYANLEIGLYRRDAYSYIIDMRFDDPQSDAGISLSWKEPATAQFDLALLQQQSLNADAYGTTLTDSLFANDNVKQAFQQAYTIAQTHNAALRVQLRIDITAPELHSLRWETLRNPLDGSVLLTNQNILFSRYLLSSGTVWRPVQRRIRSHLRALIVIANPTNITSYAPNRQQLVSLDVAGELQRATQSLGSEIHITALASHGQATIENISAHLRKGYDILYLVSHGALVKGEPYLWLEDEQGSSHVTSGSELTNYMRELAILPILVVLASCQSAGSGEGQHSNDGGVLAGLGPRLAEIGVPAIIAMQGNVTIKTVEEFMPVFFAELQQDGQLDRAMAVARGTVRDNYDWWIPTLFMRLKSGRIWYEPGFSTNTNNFDKWPALIRNISKQRSTPVLGHGMTLPLLGSPYLVAQQWAHTYNFPLEPHECNDLPAVAQYLAVNQDEVLFPHETMEEYLRERILQEYHDCIPKTLQHPQVPIQELFAAVSRYTNDNMPNDPHHMLARMDFTVYLTTNGDTLLEQALIDVGKQPSMILCPWNNHIEHQYERYDDEPTIMKPLVYHLFGHIEDPATMVLKEDDYFDYLIGFSRNRDLIPDAVLRALTNTSLLLLGFRLENWEFKVLFRSILSLGGNMQRRRYASVAVQLDPEDGQVISPDGARRYLQSYFEESDFTLFWGSATDFVTELATRMFPETNKTAA